jgi:hypothetical protein
MHTHTQKHFGKDFSFKLYSISAQKQYDSFAIVVGKIEIALKKID